MVAHYPALHRRLFSILPVPGPTASYRQGLCTSGLCSFIKHTREALVFHRKGLPVGRAVWQDRVDAAVANSWVV